ncbi:hypothetical protein H9P43_002156 [Blastocladiella emersonii ATCC 22665]|nr:hypothetical protein H9P43_002156 [Blastocladiella emersonii ATCC 22665]
MSSDASTSTSTSTSTPATAGAPYTAKIRTHGETRRVRLPRTIEWPAFLATLRQLFPQLSTTDTSSLYVTYLDDDGDTVTLSTTDELREALNEAEQLNRPPVLFNVVTEDMADPDAASIASWRSSVVAGPVLEEIVPPPPPTREAVVEPESLTAGEFVQLDRVLATATDDEEDVAAAPAEAQSRVEENKTESPAAPVEQKAEVAAAQSEPESATTTADAAAAESRNADAEEDDGPVIEPLLESTAEESKPAASTSTTTPAPAEARTNSSSSTLSSSAAEPEGERDLALEEFLTQFLGLPAELLSLVPRAVRSASVSPSRPQQQQQQQQQAKPTTTANEQPTPAAPAARAPQHPAQTLQRQLELDFELRRSKQMLERVAYAEAEAQRSLHLVQERKRAAHAEMQRCAILERQVHDKLAQRNAERRRVVQRVQALEKELAAVQQQTVQAQRQAQQQQAQQQRQQAQARVFTVIDPMTGATYAVRAPIARMY